MVPSFVIPLNYVSMALSVIAIVVAVALVSALGKAGLRSYVVGLVTFISTYYVTEIIMFIVAVIFGLFGLVDTVSPIMTTVVRFIELTVRVAVQVSALKYFMHVYLKRNTYAVFYGAGTGFAIGNTLKELLSSITTISVATLMNEGGITEKNIETFKLEMNSIENMTLAESIAGVIYPIVMTAVYVALASIIGHAVRGEQKYAYYAAGGWFVAGGLLTLQDMLGLLGWTKIVTYIAYIVIAVVLCKWSKDKYGLKLEFNKAGDYHAPLSRRIEKKKK